MEGYYLVGTGDNGAMGAFATLGLLYGATMGLGAWSMKLPPTGWTPPSYTVASPSTPSASAAPTTEGSVSAATAMRTPQFFHEDHSPQTPHTAPGLRGEATDEYENGEIHARCVRFAVHCRVVWLDSFFHR